MRPSSERRHIGESALAAAASGARRRRKRVRCDTHRRRTHARHARLCVTRALPGAAHSPRPDRCLWARVSRRSRRLSARLPQQACLQQHIVSLQSRLFRTLLTQRKREGEQGRRETHRKKSLLF